MKILIIIPAYNEAENIEFVVEDLIKTCPQYDYVVVNDGSSDDTVKICETHHYNMIDLPVNLGLSGSFQAGMKYAYKLGYDYAIQYDGDRQHNPTYLPMMVKEAIENQYDIVIGSRFLQKKRPFRMRILGNYMIQLILLATTGRKITDPTSGMRLYSKKLIMILANSLNFSPEPDTIAYLLRSGARYKEIQVEMNERVAGESYLNLTRSIQYMSHIIVSLLVFQWFRKKITL